MFYFSCTMFGFSLKLVFTLFFHCFTFWKAGVQKIILQYNGFWGDSWAILCKEKDSFWNCCIWIKARMHQGTQPSFPSRILLSTSENKTEEPNHTWVNFHYKTMPVSGAHSNLKETVFRVIHSPCNLLQAPRIICILRSPLLLWKKGYIFFWIMVNSG